LFIRYNEVEVLSDGTDKNIVLFSLCGKLHDLLNQLSIMSCRNIAQCISRMIPKLLLPIPRNSINNKLGRVPIANIAQGLNANPTPPGPINLTPQQPLLNSNPRQNKTNLPQRLLFLDRLEDG
jgi:hypothetical protein